MRVEKLNESLNPCKGIFWFIPDNDYQIIYLDVRTDSTFIGNSKNGLTYTHEKKHGNTQLLINLIILKINRGTIIQEVEQNLLT